MIKESMARKGIIILLCLICMSGFSHPAVSKDKNKKKLITVFKNTVAAYGGLAVLLRQTGKLRGLIKLYTGTDNPREGDITIRFIRRLKVPEDLTRLDLKLPTAPTLTIAYDGKRIWGAENGNPIVLYLRSEAAFKADLIHNYEAFLRSQEFGAKLQYIGEEKRSGIRLHVVDMTHADGSQTRFYISAKTWRILHLEFDFTDPAQQETVHVWESFYDFRVVQQTLVPFRVVRYENDQRVQEIRFTDVAFNVQIDKAIFEPGGGTSAASR